MVNTFAGRLIEFPDIAVDRFNINAHTYLLTHCHEDHLVGLGNTSFQSTVYCTDTTKRLLRLNDKCKDAIAFLRPKRSNEPFTVDLPDQAVQITLISSYHCAGSCMFLIEGASKSVLVTGDIRAEDWWTLALARNPYLLPYVYGMKVLDNIYIDTTFGRKGEPYIEMTTNSEGIAAVLKLLQLYPKNDPEIQFQFADLTLGFDEVWCKISTQLDANFTMNEGTKHQMQVLRELSDDGSYDKLACDNDGSLDVSLGYCPTQTMPKFRVRIKQCIDFNIVDLIGSLYPIQIATLTLEEKEQDLEWIGSTGKGHGIYRFQDRLWLLYNEMLLPNNIKLIFSRHSSYTETKKFIAMFKPREVYPCVTVADCWHNGFAMSRLFGTVCQNKAPRDFAYDALNIYELGIPQEAILKRPIGVVNRWNYEHCEQELLFVHNYLQTNLQDRLPVHGQVAVGSFNEHNTLFKERIRDFDIGTIINGKGEAKYKRFIAESQRLYRQMLKVTDPQKFTDMSEAISRVGIKVASPQDDYDQSSNYSSTETSQGAAWSQSKSESSSEQRPQAKRAKLTRRASQTTMAITQIGSSIVREYHAFCSFSQNSHPDAPVDFLDIHVVNTELNLDKVNDVCAHLTEHPDDYFGFHITALQQ